MLFSSLLVMSQALLQVFTLHLARSGGQLHGGRRFLGTRGGYHSAAGDIQLRHQQWLLRPRRSGALKSVLHFCSTMLRATFCLRATILFLDVN